MGGDNYFRAVIPFAIKKHTHCPSPSPLSLTGPIHVRREMVKEEEGEEDEGEKEEEG